MRKSLLLAFFAFSSYSLVHAQNPSVPQKAKLSTSSAIRNTPAPATERDKNVRPKTEQEVLNAKKEALNKGRRISDPAIIQQRKQAKENKNQ